MGTQTIAVSGMSCTGCERNVEDAVSEIDAVTGVTADHEAGTVEVTTGGEAPDSEIHAAIESVGYEVAA